MDNWLFLTLFPPKKGEEEKGKEKAKHFFSGSNRFSPLINLMCDFKNYISKGSNDNFHITFGWFLMWKKILKVKNKL